MRKKEIDYRKEIDWAEVDKNEGDYIDAAMERDAYHRRQEARAEEMKKKENKPAVLPASYERHIQEMKEKALEMDRKY